MPLDRRQNQLAHFGQHWLVRPGRIGNKMQQPLVLRRDFARRRHCRDRLHAPAALCNQKAGTVIIQRPLPVGVADHARQLFHKTRKSRCTILRSFEIYRSPPLASEFDKYRFSCTIDGKSSDLVRLSGYTLKMQFDA